MERHTTTTHIGLTLKADVIERQGHPVSIQYLTQGQALVLDLKAKQNSFEI